MRHIQTLRWVFERLSNIHARRNGNVVLSGMSEITIVFNSESYDTLAEYNPATGIFTALVDGYYRINAQVMVNVTDTSGDFSIWVRNPALDALGEAAYYCVAGHFSTFQLDQNIPLSAGDQILIRVANATVDPAIIMGSLYDTFLDVSRVPGLT